VIPIALVTLAEYPDAVYWQYADGHRARAGKLEQELWQALQECLRERDELRARLPEQAREPIAGD